MRVLNGEVRVGVPPERAWRLFTPEGERGWSYGWDPQYPGGAGDDTVPGTVFTIDHGPVPLTWVVALCDPPREVRYTRVAPDDHAALVTVAFNPDGEDGTIAAVSYALTPLSPAAEQRAETFAAEFTVMMADWEHAIATHLGV
jgi:hypothetical protein